jgi:hypothetical protein
MNRLSHDLYLLSFYGHLRTVGFSVPQQLPPSSLNISTRKRARLGNQGLKDTVSYAHQQVPSTAKLIPAFNIEYTGYIILVGQLKLGPNNTFPSKERGKFKKQDISLLHFMQTKFL